MRLNCTEFNFCFLIYGTLLCSSIIYAGLVMILTVRLSYSLCYFISLKNTVARKHIKLTSIVIGMQTTYAILAEVELHQVGEFFNLWRDATDVVTRKVYYTHVIL